MDSEKELYKIIDKILWEDWDPIGINTSQKARNEYYGYIPEILSLILNNSSVEEITDKLDYFSHLRMGLDSNKNHCKEIAEKIISERNKLLR